MRSLYNKYKDDAYRFEMNIDLIIIKDHKNMYGVESEVDFFRDIDDDDIDIDAEEYELGDYYFNIDNMPFYVSDYTNVVYISLADIYFDKEYDEELDPIFSENKDQLYQRFINWANDSIEQNDFVNMEE